MKTFCKKVKKTCLFLGLPMVESVFLQESAATAHCNCCSAKFSTSLLLNYAANSPQLDRIDYKSERVIRQRNNCDWTRFKKSRSDWQSSETAFEWKDAIFMFPCFFSGIAEALVRWVGKIKHLPNAFCLSNFLSKIVIIGSCVAKDVTFLRHIVQLRYVAPISSTVCRLLGCR